MPEAIATSKRKFYKALDTFTSSSQLSLAPSSSTSLGSIKRPITATEAFDEARDRARKRLRHRVSSASLSSIPVKIHSSNARVEDDVEKRDPPNFSPWSHDAFLVRLKTFSSVSLWHPKPEPISEVEWAKRGWSCVGVNTVGCKGGCEKRVVVSLEMSQRAALASEAEDGDENSESAFEQALSERYKGMIVDAHSNTCLWRRSGCKDDIYHLQVVRPTIWQPQLRQRYQSIRQIEKSIRSVKLVGSDDTDILSSLKLLQSLPTEFLETSESHMDDPVRAQALCIALHGWNGSAQSGSELLQCEACFQRVGLWMYQPDYRPSTATVDADEDGRPATLDLVELHRDHCPWRNPTTQKASGTLSGMNATQILYRVVSTFARELKRRSQDQVAGEDSTQLSADNPNATGEEPPHLSRAEILQQDKDRESKLKKLKSLFSIKRRSTKAGIKSVPSMPS